MRNFFRNTNETSWRFWTMSVFVIIAMLLGGGYRADNQSFMLLRPISIIVCCVSIWSIKWECVRANKILFIFAAAFFGILAIQLIPLPEGIWSALPGRELAVQIDNAAGIAPVWRPISMVPIMTWNALYSLFVPLAALLLGAQLTGHERQNLLVVVIIVGILGGLIGLMQVVGDPTGPLYFYKITNNGSAVGFFANRNHQAVFLSSLFPMLAVFASINIRSQQQHRIRLMIAIGAGLVLVPLLLVTGSRMGIITGLLGLISIIYLYKNPSNLPTPKRRGGGINLSYIAGGFGVFVLGLLSVLFSRAQAFQRLFASEDTQDLRFLIWGPVIEQGWKFFPFGAGAGSFAQVYQTDERSSLLFPNYVNLPHNDFIEIFFAFGMIGLILIITALIAWSVSSYRVWKSEYRDRSSIRIGKMASIIMLIFALGSVTDYPLRNPSMMVFWTICCLWCVDALRREDGQRSDS